MLSKHILDPGIISRIPLALTLALLVGLASGCASLPEPADGAQQQAQLEELDSPAVEPDLPELDLTQEMLYRLLLAEIAGHRGDFNTSLANYVSLARETRDPRVAERATRIAVYRRDNAAALEAARIWVETAPEHPDGRQVLAAILIRAGKTEEALPHLEYLLDRDPEKIGERFKMIAALLGQEQDKQAAMQAMESLIADHTDSVDALYAFAHLALRADEPGRARAMLEQVLEKSPDDRNAILLYLRTLQRMDETETAIDWLERRLSRHRDDFDYRLLYARLLVDARHYERARGQFERLAKARPDNGDVLYGLGLLYLQASMTDEARRTFEGLLAAGDRPNAAHFYLAQIEEAEQHPQEAIEHYDAIKGGDHYLDSQVRIAVLLAQTGNLDAGRQQLRAIQAHGVEQGARIAATEAELLSSVSRHEEALAVYDKGLEKFPDHLDLLYARAMTGEKLGRLDILERDLLRILELEPNNGQALNALGYTLADRTERYEEAYAYIQRALDQQPDDYYILDSMGWILYRLGRYDEAISYLRRALEKNDDPEIASHLGEVLWVSGNQEAAREVWSGALKSTPDDERLLEVIRRLDH